MLRISAISVRLRACGHNHSSLPGCGRNVTAGATLAVAIAAALAIADWQAVVRRDRALEYICKPGVMVALIAAAVTLHPHVEARRWWVVAALALSLVGDVFLMLPKDRFIFGLVAFFLAHVAYVIAFHIHGGTPQAVAWSATVVLFADAIVLPRILRALQRDHPQLMLPVMAYVVVLSAMVTSAVATGIVLAGIGGVLFLMSDGTLAWNRFVKAIPGGPLVVIITYHLAQAALVLSLVMT